MDNTLGQNFEVLTPSQIKSNIGHSESAAGLSGLMKGIMILESGLIPGNPTFETPNPDSKPVFLSRSELVLISIS